MLDRTPSLSLARFYALVSLSSSFPSAFLLPFRMILAYFAAIARLSQLYFIASLRRNALLCFAFSASYRASLCVFPSRFPFPHPDNCTANDALSRT